MVYYEPQSKDSELAVVSVVLVVVKAVAFEEPMHTEHSTDELEDVGAGYVGHQQQDHEDNDGAAGVCPAKHIKHFLEGVYYSRNHPQHQLHNLFHLVNLFQKAGTLFPQIKFFVVNDERPFLVLLVFCLLGLFEFAILC